MARHPLIELRNVSYMYEGQDRPALTDISFTVERGEWLEIIGPGGSGKSTLCALLCGVLQTWPGGTLEGTFKVGGRDRLRSPSREWSGQVGAVFQDPESSLVQEYVEDDLAFGPENLRIPPEEIEKRIDGALSEIGMPEARQKRTNELSGGQKQRVAVASVLTMQPDILVLDDPFAHLDRPGAERLMKTLAELYRRGHTIISASPRLKRRSPANRLVVLHEGKIAVAGTPEEMFSEHEPILIRLGVTGTLPTPKSAKAMQNAAKIPGGRPRPGSGEPVLQIRDLNFSYDSRTPVLQKVNMNLFAGDFAAVLGPNGSGKTTFGKLLAGLLPAPAGSIRFRGSDLSAIPPQKRARMIGYVFQHPEHQFVSDTVLEECLFGWHTGSGGSREDRPPDSTVAKVENRLENFGLLAHRNRHPLELSAAEKRLLNLASVLLPEPEIVILDEPTAGLDYAAADRLMAHCAEYASRGNIIVMITHDTEIVGKWANKPFTFPLNHPLADDSA